MKENGDKSGSGYDKKDNSDKKHSLKISSESKFEYETGIDSQSQSDEKAGFHETMQSNDSDIVRSNEAHKNDVKHKSLVREDEESGKENSGTSDVRFEEAENRVELEQCVEMLSIHILNR